MVCQHKKCNNRSNFNYSDQLNGLFCSTHKLDGMIDIKRKICLFDTCSTRANFNYIGEKHGKYCNKHKLDDMVNISIKKCEIDNCINKAIYNIPKKSSPLYCEEHKLDDMIDVVINYCKFKNCTKRPNYNYQGVRPPIYCKEHKLDDMIDVAHILCTFDSCFIIACFNYEDQKIPLYCNSHKLDDMIDIKSKRCKFEDCLTRPNYNYPGKTSLYCSVHKLDGMIDVIHKYCMMEHCNTMVSNLKYKGYCVRCFMYTYPNEPVSRNYKTKEKHVADYIAGHFGIYTLNFDIKIVGGCSRRRPDILLDFGDQVIIVEVDENQHKQYETTCENKRLMQLSQDIDHRPLVFIRFNPDSYKDNNDKTIKSCFQISKTTGILSIGKKKEWNERLSALKDEIGIWVDKRTDKMIEVISLYYDENI